MIVVELVIVRVMVFVSVNVVVENFVVVFVTVFVIVVVEWAIMGYVPVIVAVSVRARPAPATTRPMISVNAARVAMGYPIASNTVGVVGCISFMPPSPGKTASPALF
jgi:hypothetical protein